MNFTKLAQANVDHFNNHPASHNTIIAVYAVVAAVAINKLALRLSGNKKYTK
jgi:hypothetical protein